MLKDVEGIILKERDYGESSKILDLFTKEYGVIGIISKGSKKVKSKLSGVSSRLTYGLFHIYYKEGKLSILNSVDVYNPLLNIRNSIINISFATYLSELVHQVLNQSLKKDEIYNLFISSILKINELYDPLVITNILELKLLKYLGVEPILDRCSVCGKSTNIVTISADKNGLLCNKCRFNEKLVDLKVIKYLRMYYYLDISKISKIEMDSKIKNEIDDFLTDYYNTHTGIYLNCKKFIDDLKMVNIYT